MLIILFLSKCCYECLSRCLFLFFFLFIIHLNLCRASFQIYCHQSPHQVRPSKSVSQTLQARIEGHEPPAKSLAAEAKEVGTGEQYDALMEVLEKNQASADKKQAKKALKKLHKAGFGY